jgi:spore coat protein A, manganese oxidase
MLSRRDFLKVTAAATGASFYLLSPYRSLAQSILGKGANTIRNSVPTLDPLTIPKYINAVVIPPVLQPSQAAAPGTPFSEYKVAARQFIQQMLPTEGYNGDVQTPFPTTTVWGYGSAENDATFHTPSFTIEARSDETVRVHWINQLVDNPGASSPNFLPHLLPVDQTLHWANPPGPRDHNTMNPEPYTGPVPIVTHLHGAHVPDISDGYPEAWYLPAAANIPAEYFSHGSHFRSVIPADPGEAVFEYPNDQRAATLWYHDHTLGITRLNVYAGLAGFYILRDETEDNLNLPGPSPRLDDPPGTRYYEIPLAIQDRSFNEDGSLFYPDSRLFFDGDEFEGPFIPETDVPPIWNPEFFGNSIIVNGKTWPYLEVEPRKYRLRLLNGCNSRFLILTFDQELNFHWIGNEGGLLADSPVVVDEILLAPAERADVIVDFSAFNPGDEILLLNLGPDAPLGELPIPEEEQADPETTGQVMQFRVVNLTAPDTSEIPTALPAIEPLGEPDRVRTVTLHEMDSAFAEIPIMALLGTGERGMLPWDAPITESMILGQTEIWQMVNLTMDAHPIHLHQVMFQVLDRVPFNMDEYEEAQMAYLEGGGVGPAPDPLDFATGDPMEPEEWENGWKETVIAYPDQITRITARFDLPGLYVWHCHILEHEDNEMMRPFVVERPVHLPLIHKNARPGEE